MDMKAWDTAELEKVLGSEKVDSFRRSFLAHRGCTTSQIDDVLDRHKNGPLKRRINDLRRCQKAMRRTLPSSQKQTDSPADSVILSFGDDISMRLRLVQKGEYLMGAAGTPEEAGCEGPQRVVRIEKPFYLGEFPVTQTQFAALMDTNPSRCKGDSDRPVDNVSWFAALEFCMRLSKKAGRWVRLPSEAEWEYACRAGSSGKFHWGEDATGEHVNCKTGDLLQAFPADPAEDSVATTNVQGRFPPNAWGFYDMHGNVQEWCEDEWHNGYTGAPSDGTAWLTTGDENPFRPLRGGSCWHYATACTSAARQQLRADSGDKLDEPDEDGLLGSIFGHGPHWGFRVVVEVD
jgi:formylglycine-generating enzyme required for sulfatase activity